MKFAVKDVRLSTLVNVKPAKTALSLEKLDNTSQPRAKPAFTVTRSLTLIDANAPVYVKGSPNRNV